jgi:hypothetical protein
MLSPGNMAMMVGDENATLSLADQNGNVVTGATWSVDNSTVIGLSTDDPPLLAGLTPGTATVTATLGSLSAQSVITVYPYGPGHRYPAGTVLWTLLPASGSFVGQMLRTAPGSAADFIGIEVDATGKPLLARGVTSSGQQLWQAPLPQYVIPAGNTLNPYAGFGLVADDVGGAVAVSSSITPTQASVASLTRIDGSTGAMAWRYDQPNGSMDGGVTASASSVWAVETLAGTAGSESYLTQLDEQTGSVLQRNLLPSGQRCGDDTGVTNAGPISVLPDGSVALALNTQLYSRTPNTESLTDTLYVAVLQANGTFGVTPLDVATESCSPTCGLEVDLLHQPETVAPDGQGGLLVVWDAKPLDPRAGTTHVTRTDITGAPLADYPLPVTGIGGNDQIVLGEGGNAFASNGLQLAAFNAANGNSVFTFTAPGNHNIALGPALWGGGIAVTDIDLDTGSHAAARFDALGNLLYDAFDSAGLVPNTTWPTLGVWSGVNASGAYTQIAESEIVPADSLWGFPGGNPSGNRTAAMVFESMPFWGKSVQAKAPAVPACALPITVNGVTLPPAEPVTDTAVKENAKLQDKLKKLLDAIVQQDTINSKSCAKFFSDPKRAQYYSILEVAVMNQQWFNGHLSTISRFDMGGYQDGETQEWLDKFKHTYISCLEAPGPTLLQLENANPGEQFNALTGVSQLQMPANSAYYNGAALDYLFPSVLVHETLHNLTRLYDGNLRAVLGMRPVDPTNQSTDDISKKLEDEGCAPGR